MFNYMISDIILLCALTAELTQSYTHGTCVRGYTHLRHTLRERRAVERREKRFNTLQSGELLSVVANSDTESQFEARAGMA